MTKRRLPDGRYTLKCKVCGLQRGEFKPDSRKGVV
jgi:hypothetical protein